MNFITGAIGFLDDYERDGGLEKASKYFGDVPALAPKASKQYSDLVEALKDVLGLALALGEDDAFFFENRGGEEVCARASKILEELE